MLLFTLSRTLKEVRVAHRWEQPLPTQITVLMIKFDTIITSTFAKVDVLFSVLVSSWRSYLRNHRRDLAEAFKDVCPCDWHERYIFWEWSGTGQWFSIICPSYFFFFTQFLRSDGLIFSILVCERSRFYFGYSHLKNRWKNFAIALAKVCALKELLLLLPMSF